VTAEPARIGNVLYPVPDVAAAVAFYRDALGLAVKFQDGSRYAALDGGGVTFAIAAAEESVAGPLPAASFKVTDLHAALERLTAAGATVVTPATEGPHEVRAALRDPAGNPFVLYAPRPQ
jgi:predicted enzyme related to lactoylglutathione lyase